MVVVDVFDCGEKFGDDWYVSGDGCGWLLFVCLYGFWKCCCLGFNFGFVECDLLLWFVGFVYVGDWYICISIDLGDKYCFFVLFVIW